MPSIIDVEHVSPFHRYEGLNNLDKDTPRRMLFNTLRARVSPSSITELILRFESFTTIASERKLHSWASRFVMGYPLPDWQRDACWTQNQKIKFIESIWNKVDIGSYMVNTIFEYEDPPCNTVFKKFSDALLDGQQRLSAIEDYLLNKFPVYDGNGSLCFWKDLGIVDRRFFGNKSFSKAIIQTFDEKILRECYDLRSFGGTAHREDERALPL